MKKYHVAVLLVLAFVVGMMAGVGGLGWADQPIKVYINGKEMVSDQPPTIINDRVFVPLRAVSETLGAKVSWDYYRQAAFIATYSDPEQIEIVGSDEFKKAMRDALALLKEKAPEDYRFVGQYVRRIETHNRSYSSPGLYNMTVYVTKNFNIDSHRLASTIVHEAQHIEQMYSVRGMTVDQEETEAYQRGLNVLKKTGASQELIEGMQKWIDTKAWNN